MEPYILPGTMESLLVDPLARNPSNVSDSTPAAPGTVVGKDLMDRTEMPLVLSWDWWVESQGGQGWPPARQEWHSDMPNRPVDVDLGSALPPSAGTRSTRSGWCRRLFAASWL